MASCKETDLSVEKQLLSLERQLKDERSSHAQTSGDCSRAHESHRAQIRNTLAFQTECEELLEALELCVEWMPRAEVRSWPPGFRLRDEALAMARSIIKKVKVT